MSLSAQEGDPSYKNVEGTLLRVAGISGITVLRDVIKGKATFDAYPKLYDKVLLRYAADMPPEVLRSSEQQNWVKTALQREFGDILQ